MPIAFVHAASEKSRRTVSSRTAVKFTPADVIITAIYAQAHNPVLVMNAEGYVSGSSDASLQSLTIPPNKSTADKDVFDGKLHVVLPYTSDLEGEKPDIKKFHIMTGHGTYVFVNTQFEVAAYKLAKDLTSIQSKKGLLLPWEDKRKVELVVGHDGKLELRVPGSLAKSVHSEKSKKVKK
jgi:hypothetical protein